MTSKKRFRVIFAILILVLISVKAGAKNLAPDSISSLLNRFLEEERIELLLSSTQNLVNRYPEQAAIYAERALVLSIEKNDSVSWAFSNYLLATVHRILGQYNVALEHLDFAHGFFLSQNDSSRLTESYQLYSDIFVKLGDFSKAIDNCQNALHLAIQIDDKRQIADLTRKYGNIYFYFNEVAIALDFFYKSLQRSEDCDYAKGIIKANNNIGRIYVELGKYDIALEYLLKSLADKKEQGDRASYGNTLINIASIYIQKEEYQKAISFLHDAYQNYVSVCNSEGMSNSQYYLGVVYKKIGGYHQAIDYQNRAYKIASDHNLQVIMVKITHELADIYKKTGDYPKAHSYLTTHIELRDSVFSQEKARLLMELETRYQLAGKQRQIELLSKERALEESKIKQNRIWLIFLVVLILLLVALLQQVYKRFRLKNSMNQVLLQEINRRKESEKQLNVYHEQLECLVEERTQELEEAKNRAEESDKLKSAFLANMSHEIRTPLNAIVGFSHLLTNSDIDDNSKAEFKKIIKSNGEVLIKLINDILDISIIEAGQLKIKAKPFELHVLLEELRFFFSQEIMRVKSAATLTTDYDVRCNAGLLITTDKVRLRQILSNLLWNAVKFTPKGKIVLGYRLSGFDKIVFFVKDTGIGIDPKNHELVFYRFSKLSAGTGGAIHYGTGLGLAICQEMVTALGGQIWVDSLPGKGSTFYFTLPFDEEHRSYIKGADKFEADMELLKGKTILIGEDVESTYNFIRYFLAGLQMNIVWAKDGIEVINELRENSSIDIILMKMSLPILDGVNTLKNIRKFRASIPVIVNTTFYSDSDKDKCFEAGCNAFIEKPFCNNDLILKIIELLKRFG